MSDHLPQEQDKQQEQANQQTAGEPVGNQAESTQNQANPSDLQPESPVPTDAEAQSAAAPVPELASAQPQAQATDSAAEHTAQPAAAAIAEPSAPAEDQPAHAQQASPSEAADDAENTTDEEDNQQEDSEEHLAEEQSYERMSIEELLVVSNEMLISEDLKKGDRFFEIVKPIFQDYLKDHQEKARKIYLEENNTDEGYDPPSDVKVDAFFDNLKKHKQNKKDLFEKQKKEREDNLKEKKELLEELKKISQDTEQIHSVRRVKEIQEKWRSIGSVPAPEAEELYNSYDALIKIFYDTKSIEYDLKELDRKKNLDAKILLCEKAEALIGEENINEVVKKLNKLHDDFKIIGPVPREEQEKVWSRFKAASDKIYEKKRAFSEEFKKQLQENMQAKQELCLKVEEFMAYDSDRIKEWNNKTKELIDLQEQWNNIGPMPREVAKDINKQFWNNFKAFFNNKNAFFDKLEAERTENLKKKQEMVAKATELKESTDWNSAADQLKALQKDWKNVGPVPEKYRESVYQEFKAAIDYFFERKRNRKADREKEQVENLEKKKEICAQIRQLAKAEDNSFEKFQELKEAYYTAGFVPAKNISETLEDFVTSAEKYYEQSELAETKAEGAIASFHAEVAERVPNADRILGQKEQTLRRRITAIENDIALWQNNLAFFANSKTADKLKAEFEGKIKASSDKLESLKHQLKVMRSVKRSSPKGKS